MTRFLLLPALLLPLAHVPAAAQQDVPRFSVHEAALASTGNWSNPYVQVRAEALVTKPDGAVWRIPLFWDGGANWKLRVSPDTAGRWTWRVSSNDPGLDGRHGSFRCSPSDRAGSIVPSRRWPGHFERQNGSLFWFLGDTAWAYFTDIAAEKHDRAQAEAYARARAKQGFNAIHCMLLSEGGDGNSGGPPWQSIAEERINPAYFQEVDRRVAFANSQGLIVGIAVAWGDKQATESYPWRRMPSVDARKRYARYAAARYGAYETYFLVSGEWHGEIRTRQTMSENKIFEEFVEIGNDLSAAEPHGRMIGIHPMGSQGSSREFRAAAHWMSFADYQQNYTDLHGKVLLSRAYPAPVINSEYGYLLRDQNGDGKPDKSNSYSTEDMRHASWDIVMAGGYLVTGFGTTYFGGHRDPGPFDLNAAKNKDWEAQIGHIRKLFESLEWWRLLPADVLVSAASPRLGDSRTVAASGARELRPPVTTYWALADPGRTYLAYVRGVTSPVRLDLGARAGRYRARLWDPRRGAFTAPSVLDIKDSHQFTPPTAEDWVMLLESVDE